MKRIIVIALLMVGCGLTPQRPSVKEIKTTKADTKTTETIQNYECDWIVINADLDSKKAKIQCNYYGDDKPDITFELNGGM